MPDLRISSSIAPLLILLAAVPAVLLAAYAYRQTVPPVAPRLRRSLITLRSFGLWCTFLLLAEPVVAFIHRSEEPPTTLLLVDNSQSMTLEDHQGKRAEALRAVLTSAEFQRLASLGSVQAISFDASARPVQSFAPDSFRLTGERTNIAEAFKAARAIAVGRNAQAVVLISDGNATAGEDPVDEASSMGLPLFTVGIGDTTAAKDIAVRTLLTNEIAYVGSSVPVNATIRSAGFGGERIVVSLMNGSATLDQSTVTLEPGVREYPATFSFTPKQEGLLQISVNVSTLEGEVTTLNNRRSASVKVLKSKMRVLLVAGAPSADVATIRRGLASDKNLEVQTFVQRTAGEFYEGVLTETAVKNSDCIVLVGYPGAGASPQSVLTILDKAQQGKPVLFVLSRTVDGPKFKALESVLPVTLQQGSQNEFEALFSVAESERGNVLLNIPNVPESFWNSLPPLMTTQAIFKPKPQAAVIASKRLAAAPLNEPMLVARSGAPVKSVALLGYGLSRWTMQGPDGQRAVEQWLSNTVRWLTTREDANRFTVRPAKDVFLSTERATLYGQVYDENYQPVENATVTVRVRSGGDESSVVMESLGSGRYEGGFDVLDVGNYSYTADASANGTAFGTDRGTFSVGGVNAEFQETQLNAGGMMQMAAQTGGKYFHAAHIDGLADAVGRLPQFKPKEVERASDITLWNEPRTLIVIVLCFALEWILRKRAGML